MNIWATIKMVGGLIRIFGEKPFRGSTEIKGESLEAQGSELPEIWAAVGNIKKICRYGPGKVEERFGTKHFRGGAKIYVIDAFWGMCDSVTVIGQHRKSRRFICLHMRVKHIENLRPRLVYSPTVQALIQKHYEELSHLPGKEDAEKLCAAVSEWQNL